MTKTLRSDLSDPREILADASDVGGSAQFTDPVSARVVFATEDDFAPYFVVDAYAYGVARDAEGNDLDNMSAEEGDVADWRVDVMLMESHCIDYTDPGSSEVSADVRYETRFGRTYTEVPDEAELKAVLNQYLDELLAS